MLSGAREAGCFREVAALHSDHLRQVPLYKHLASFVRSLFTLMKTQGQNVCIFNNDICPTISASGAPVSVIMLVPSHAEFFQIRTYVCMYTLIPSPIHMYAYVATIHIHMHT